MNPSAGEASIAMTADQRRSMDPNNWEEGEFSCVAGRDIDKLREVIESLQAIEGDAASRLQDEQVCVTWHVTEARKRIADEKRMSNRRLQLSAKRVLVESPWLKFGNLGSVIFRFYPRGDGSALTGGSTIFLWMAKTPGVSFSFNLQFGRSDVRSPRKGSDSAGTIFATAPRLWQADMVHYRMDVSWSEVSAVLADLSHEECLDLSINVLQWHIIKSPEADQTQMIRETTLRPEEVVGLTPPLTHERDTWFPHGGSRNLPQVDM